LTYQPVAGQTANQVPVFEGESKKLPPAMPMPWQLSYLCIFYLPNYVFPTCQTHRSD